MKKLFVCTLAVALASSTITFAQDEDKSKRPSPPAEVSGTTKSGAEIKINYSQPSVKGRTIGKDIATYGKVWRTGANEATVFETSKDVMIEGKALPAGKYSLYTIPGKDEWTIIFNKTWEQWGTDYKEADDALRVKVKPGKAPSAMEKMTFAIDKSGKVSLMWGTTQASFTVS